MLDLDNALWGGVIGEDGLEGIALCHTYPGICYREFQQELLKLYHRGVILAINSKNNEADALRAIDEHPDMVLRPRHFAAMQINWTDKATNLRALAKTLNIGLDSLVLLDDDPVERARVRQSLPVVAVPELPGDPAHYVRRLSDAGYFEAISFTLEDQHRGDQYVANSQRAGSAAAISLPIVY